MMGYWGYGYGMGAFGWVFMALFWGAVIWVIVWLIRQQGMGTLCSGQRHEPHYRERNAREMLDERYAKGELTRKEFLAMRKDIDK